MERTKFIEKRSYSELLKDPKWQEKRLRIMDRDHFRCRICNTNEVTLNVHHKKYIKGKAPWEYSDADLLAVCEDCHLLIRIFTPFDICSCSIPVKSVNEYFTIYYILVQGIVYYEIWIVQRVGSSFTVIDSLPATLFNNIMKEYKNG
jgi:hypothetical protein